MSPSERLVLGLTPDSPGRQHSFLMDVRNGAVREAVLGASTKAEPAHERRRRVLVVFFFYCLCAASIQGPPKAP